MNQQKYFGMLFFTLCLITNAQVVNAKFMSDMTPQQLSHELALWVKSGMSLNIILKEAHQAGLSTEQIVIGLIETGQKPAEVVVSLINIDPQSASMVTSAAIRVAPKHTQAIYAAAITAPGLDPSLSLSASSSQGEYPAERR